MLLAISWLNSLHASCLLYTPPNHLHTGLRGRSAVPAPSAGLRGPSCGVSPLSKESVGTRRQHHITAARSFYEPLHCFTATAMPEGHHQRASSMRRFLSESSIAVLFRLERLQVRFVDQQTAFLPPYVPAPAPSHPRPSSSPRHAH